MSFAFCCAKASMVPSSSRFSLKSSNFTAAFISSRSVTVPCVASRSPASKSPRPSRSNALRIPSPCLASSMPWVTHCEISDVRLLSALAAIVMPFVMRLPPSTCNIPLILSPLNRPPPPPFGACVVLSSLFRSSSSRLALMVRVRSWSSDALRA